MRVTVPVPLLTTLVLPLIAPTIWLEVLDEFMVSVATFETVPLMVIAPEPVWILKLPYVAEPPVNTIELTPPIPEEILNEPLVKVSLRPTVT